MSLTDLNDLIGGTVQIDESEELGAKYFKIVVPDYDDETGTQDPTDKSSFIFLGKSNTFYSRTEFNNFTRDGLVECQDMLGSHLLELRPNSGLTNANLSTQFGNNLGAYEHTDGKRLTTTSGAHAVITRGDSHQVINGGYSLSVHGDYYISKTGTPRGDQASSINSQPNGTANSPDYRQGVWAKEILRIFDSSTQISEYYVSGSQGHFREVTTTGAYSKSINADSTIAAITADHHSCKYSTDRAWHSFEVNNSNLGSIEVKSHADNRLLIDHRAATSVQINHTTGGNEASITPDNKSNQITVNYNAGETVFNVNGDNDSYFHGESATCNIGSFEELFIGDKASQFLGLKEDLFLGADFCQYIGVKRELKISDEQTFSLSQSHDLKLGTLASCYSLSKSLGLEMTVRGLLLGFG